MQRQRTLSHAFTRSISPSLEATDVLTPGYRPSGNLRAVGFGISRLEALHKMEKDMKYIQDFITDNDWVQQSIRNRFQE